MRLSPSDCITADDPGQELPYLGQPFHGADIRLRERGGAPSRDRGLRIKPTKSRGGLCSRTQIVHDDRGWSARDVRAGVADVGGQVEDGRGSLWAHLAAGITVLGIIVALYAPLVFQRA